MTSAVVTGGAGFIGSHLTEELLKRGYQVTVLDNLSTGKLSNIEHLVDDHRASFVNGSITDLSLLRGLFKGIDFVFHQAALSSVPRSIRDPMASNEANITGTLSVLVAAYENKVRKVVCASSSSVYGDTPVLPKVETMSPNPRSPYSVTKLSGEHYCRVFGEVYGLETVSLRYFNVYGPRQDPDSPYAAVIPLFFKKVLAGEAPTIFGDGEQSRDFTFVKDVAQANVLAAESKATGVFNIGSANRVTINQLFESIARLCGNATVKPVHVERRAGDVLHSLSDISRAGTFGYRPKYSLEEGLRETFVASVRENS
jgi:UDP-glucose 4-epimerase